MKLKNSFIHVNILVLVFLISLAWLSGAYALESVNYVDENNTSRSASAEKLTSDLLGSTSTGITSQWCYAGDSLTISDKAGITIASSVNTSNIYLILVDGKSLTVSGVMLTTSADTFTIYGQSGQTGTLSVTDNLDTKNLIINGGTIQVQKTGIRAYNDLTINNGDVDVAAIFSKQAITITGGKVKTTGIFCSTDLTISGGQIDSGAAATPGNIKLSCKNDDDYIYIATYELASKITIEGSLYADGKRFTGTVKAEDINGKKLSPKMTVSFNANGGTGTMSSTVQGRPGATVTLPKNTFTRTSYTFKSWNTKADGSGTSYSDGASVTLPIDGLSVLYAQWTPVNYTITYDLDGGTNDSANPKTYTIETSTITLNPPVKPGYEFVNWYLDGNAVTSIAKGSTGNKTLRAVWRVITYSILYDLDGGSANNPIQYTIETSTFMLNNPVKNGYEFTSWTGTDLTEAVRTVAINKGSTGDRVYTAHYSQGTNALKALDVSIRGAEIISIIEGTETALEYEAVVTGIYADGSRVLLSANDYSLRWSLSKNIDGVSFSNDGILSINSSLSAGDRVIKIQAEAVQGSITGSAVKNIELSVNKSQQDNSDDGAEYEFMPYGTRITATSEDLALMSPEAKSIVRYLELIDTRQRRVTDLTKLNLSGLTNLITLDLSGLSHLERADLRYLPVNIENVDLHGTNITAVDARGCYNLVKLGCSFCDINSNGLNLSGCENLEYLDISGNHFAWFNYRITDLPSLQELICSGQRIANWTGNKVFDFSQFFWALQGGKSDKNNLPELNRVKGVTAYDESGEGLTADYNSLTGIAEFSGVPAVISYYYKTGFDDILLDVRISAKESDSENTEPESDDKTVSDDKPASSDQSGEPEANFGSSGGGCNAGLSLSSLILAAFVFMKRP